MTAFTISANANIDSLTPKTGDDTYTINGATLTIDQHSRYGQNNNTSATMSSVSPSAILGGSVAIEGRYSRLIPFDNASGTVPAYNTAIAGTAAFDQVFDNRTGLVYA